MYKFFTKKLLNFEKDGSKLNYNFIKYFKNYSILVIIFSLFCMLIVLLNIILSQ